jgi:hypothetical protein
VLLLMEKEMNRKERNGRRRRTKGREEERR